MENNVEIYLADSNISFMSYKIVKEHIGFKAENYKKVYSLAMETMSNRIDMLENIYMHFNLSHPTDYNNRSISVGDIVVIDHKEYWICDRYGWRNIDGEIVL